jgi:hypothetical protein
MPISLLALLAFHLLGETEPLYSRLSRSAVVSASSPLEETSADWTVYCTALTVHSGCQPAAFFRKQDLSRGQFLNAR